ncbi:MAG: trigger factor [Ignavibacteriaceae bacterium]|nr:trigger factor [Ignavibacteriaceae bacterium]
MEFNVNDVSSSEKEVEIKLSYDEIKEDIQLEVKQQTKKIQLPGFRKGKVPPTMAKKMYGDALEHEASEKVANAKFWDVAKDNNLNPIGQPVMTNLDFKPGENLNFKVKFEVLPVLDIKNYTGQDIDIPDLKVTDEEVQKEIDHIIKSNSTTEQVEQADDGNNYILDVEMFRLKDDGSPVGDGKGENLQIDLSKEEIKPEILEKAKGKKTGDSFTFTFDEERKIKNKNGKEEQVKETYNYKALVKTVKKITLPELNEELIKKATKDKISNETDLRNEIKKDFTNYYAQKTDEYTHSKLIRTITKSNDFTAPSTMVNNILEDMVKSEEERLKKEGVHNFTSEELKKHLHPSAENEVKWYLIKNEILKKEKLEVTDSDLEELAKKDAEKTGLPVEKLVSYYKTSQQSERFLDKKLLDFLKEKNNINKVDPEKLAQTEKEENNEKSS